MIVFQPGNSSAVPPSPDDPSWSLNDADQWKATNKFPVYAVPGFYGGLITYYLGQYSGNMTDVPYGPQLVELYDPRDLTRLFTNIVAGGGGAGLPSLWVFLIIVLAILVVVVALTSFILHWIQRKNRRDLQRRIATGEVNLEALGIKRLNVPQELLDKMPQYVFTSKETAPNENVPTNAPGLEDEASAEAVSVGRPRIGSIHGTASQQQVSTRQVPFSQPTCSICLDDFEHNQTIVRELPCSHIFHPECIDGFLRDNSSLCPMCKKSALPKGYCATNVTNAMVRRERLIRRMRERVTLVQLEDGSSVPERTEYRHLAMRSRMTRLWRTTSVMRTSGPDTPTTTELAPTQSTAESQVPAPAPPPEVQRAGTAARRAWGRNRAASVVMRSGVADDEVRAMEQSLPKCELKLNSHVHVLLLTSLPGRRALGKLIPTLV